MNKVIIKGRLGADPDVRSTQSGKAVAKLRIAVDRRGKDAGVDWFDVIAWEQRAEFCQKYLSKGRSVLIEGRLQARQFEKDGQKRIAVEIIADNIEFADSKPQEGQAAAQPQAPAAPQQPAPQAVPPAPAAPPAPQGPTVTDDDIPF